MKKFSVCILLVLVSTGIYAQENQSRLDSLQQVVNALSSRVEETETAELNRRRLEGPRQVFQPRLCPADARRPDLRRGAEKRFRRFAEQRQDLLSAPETAFPYAEIRPRLVVDGHQLRQVRHEGVRRGVV